MASLSSASRRRILRQVRQREAATGRKADQGYIEGLMRQELEVAASKATQNRALEIQQEGLDESKRQFDESLEFKKNAASASGKVDLASLGLTGALLLKDTKTGKAIGETVGKGVEGVKNVFSPTEPGAAAETVAPATSATQPSAGAAGIGLGANEQNIVADFDFSSLSQTQTGATTSGAATEGAASTAGASTTQIGLGATGAAGIGRVIGGQSGDSTAKDVSTIGAGALYGTVALGPGFGTVVGAAVGVVYDVVADEVGTIICSELNRQGYMSDEILELDRKYRQKYVDKEVYEGYLILAQPIVDLMKKSVNFTKFIAPFALAWAHEMASRVDPKIKGSVLGKFINYIGQPLCRLAHQRRLCHG